MSLAPSSKVDIDSTIPWYWAILLILVASGAYGVAFATRTGAGAMLVALPCLFLLARLKTERRAFYLGFVCGLGIYVPHLWFFHAIFGSAAIALWCIAALPVGLFTALQFRMRGRFGTTVAMWATPVLWVGVEYFKSEFTYLKFPWMTPGQVVAFLPGIGWLHWCGLYGLAFLMALGGALIIGRGKRFRLAGTVLLLLLAAAIYLPRWSVAETKADPLHVAGVQLEYPTPGEVAETLDKLATQYPEAQILVTSEYTFGGPVPEIVREVIRKHHRYLVTGGAVNLVDANFRDMAFVIDPDGHDIFQQCKSVPVQFMRDGLPAESQKVWDSPWGKIGIAICYDVGYTRVMDNFIKAGAQGLIIPTMDMKNWGGYERTMLHGRLAPIRAAEYGVPVFGVWSSGESQLTDREGRVMVSGSYPGQGEVFAGPFDLAKPGSGKVPWDRHLALLSSGLTGLFVVFLFGENLRRQWAKWRQQPTK